MEEPEGIHSKDTALGERVKGEGGQPTPPINRCACVQTTRTVRHVAWSGIGARLARHHRCNGSVDLAHGYSARLPRASSGPNPITTARGTAAAPRVTRPSIGWIPRRAAKTPASKGPPIGPRVPAAAYTPRAQARSVGGVRVARSATPA